MDTDAIHRANRKAEAKLSSLALKLEYEIEDLRVASITYKPKLSIEQHNGIIEHTKQEIETWSYIKKLIELDYE